jgi:hypothetical protein
VLSSRYSPSRGTFFDLFEDLVHFVNVFPHPRLTLEVILTEQDEHRVPRKARRWKGKDYRVTDRQLRSVVDRLELRTNGHLAAFLPETLPDRFTTRDIAEAADIPRWLAQKMAFCLRKTGAVEAVGKEGNSLLYELAVPRARNKAA